MGSSGRGGRPIEHCRKLSYPTWAAAAGGGVLGERTDEAGLIGVQLLAQARSQQPELSESVEPRWVDGKRVRWSVCRRVAASN